MFIIFVKKKVSIINREVPRGKLLLEPTNEITFLPATNN